MRISHHLSRTELITKLLVKITQSLTDNLGDEAVNTVNTLLNTYGSDLGCEAWQCLLQLLTDPKRKQTVFGYLFSQNRVHQIDAFCKEKIEPYLVNLPIVTQREFYYHLAKLYFDNWCFKQAVCNYNISLRMEERSSKESKELSATEQQLTSAEIAALLFELLEIKPAFVTLEETLPTLQRLDNLLDGLMLLGHPTLVMGFYHQLAPWLEQVLRLWDEALTRSRNQLPVEKATDAFATAWKQMISCVEHFGYHQQWEWVRKVIDCFQGEKGKNIKCMNAEAKAWLVRLELKDLGKEQPIAPMQLHTAEFRRSLQACREQLSDTRTDILVRFKNYTDGIVLWLRSFFKECVELLGPTPCEFVILGKGSLARGDFCLASDLDIVILLEDGKYRETPYFQVLLKIIRTRLLCIDREGCLTLDPGEGELIGDAKQFIANPSDPMRWQVDTETINTTQTDPYARCFTRPLYVNHVRTEEKADVAKNKLWMAYQHQLLDHLQSSTADKKESAHQPHHKMALHKIVGKCFFARHLKQFKEAQESKAETVNIKSCYLEPLTYLCLDLALYFGLKDEQGMLLTRIPEILHALQRKELLNRKFVRQMHEAWKFLQQLRLELQLAWLAQRSCCNLNRDECYRSTAKIASAITLQLTPSQEKRIDQIEQLILQPTYQALSHYLLTSTTDLLDAKEQSREFKDERILPKNSPIKNSTQSLDLDPIFYNLQQLILNSQVEQISAATQLRAVIEALYERRSKPLDYVNVYQRLPSSLKELFYITLMNILRKQTESLPTMLNQHIADYAALSIDSLGYNYWEQDLTIVQCLLETIGGFPHTDGNRPYYLESLYRWQQLLTSFTESLPKEAKSDWSKLTDRWVMQWVDHSGRIITRVIKHSILENWKKKGYLNKTNELHSRGHWPKQDGRGRVMTLENEQGIQAYAKCYPEMPGIQYLVERLAWRASGFGCLSTLVKCTNTTTGAFYPILFSQAAGKTLQEILRDKGNLKEVEENLDPYCFTLKVLETLWLMYEDDKFDNIGVVPFLNINGQMSYRLVSFDCDRALVQPLLKSESAFITEIKVNAKSAILCMEPMKNPLDFRAIQAFCELDPFQVLQQWLLEQDRISKATTAIKPEDKALFSISELLILAEAKPDASYLQAAFANQTVKQRLYQRLLRLQSLLQPLLKNENSVANHLELFAQMEPAQTVYYEKSWKQHHTTEERFHGLPTDYIIIEEKSTSPLDDKVKSAEQSQVLEMKMNPIYYHQTVGFAKDRMIKTLTLPNAKDIKSLKEAIQKGCFRTPQLALEIELIPAHEAQQRINLIRDQLQQGEIKEFQQFKADDFLREQVLYGLKWQDLKPAPPVTKESFTIEILKAMTSGKFYTLNFNECEFLTDALLLDIVKSSPELRELNISYCPKLTSALFSKLSALCPRLEKLNAKNLKQITAFSQLNIIDRPSGSINFPQLRRLWLDGCLALTHINLHTQVLDTLSINGCVALTSLEISGMSHPWELEWDPKPFFEEFAQVVKRIRLAQTLKQQILLFPWLKARAAINRQPLSEIDFWEDLLNRFLEGGLIELQANSKMTRPKTDVVKCFYQDLATISQQILAKRSPSLEILPTLQMNTAEINFLLLPLLGEKNFDLFPSRLQNYLLARSALEYLEQQTVMLQKDQFIADADLTRLYPLGVDIALLAEGVKKNPALQAPLWHWLERSKDLNPTPAGPLPEFQELVIYTKSNSFKIQKRESGAELDPTLHKVVSLASFSITLLNHSGISFANKDLRDVQIPGANLYGAILYETDLSYADLRGVTLTDAFFYNTKLISAKLEGVLWPTESYYKNIRILSLADSISACCYSTDGSRIAVASGSDVYLYNALTLRPWWHCSSLLGNRIPCLDLSSNNSHLAFGVDKTVYVWDIASGHKALELDHPKWINDLNYCPDGRQLASGSYDEHLIHVWNTITGQLIYQCYGYWHAMAYSLDGCQIAIGSCGVYGVVEILDAFSGRVIKKLETNEYRTPGIITALNYRPDGRELAVGSADEKIRLWNVSTGEHLEIGWLFGGIADVCYRPDGNQLAASGEHSELIIWDCSSGRKIWRTYQPGRHAVVSYRRDGRQLAAGGDGKEIYLYDTSSDRELSDLYTPHLRGSELEDNINFSTAWAVSYSPDGCQLASTHDTSLCIWDTFSSRLMMKITGFKYLIHALSYRPDGRQIATVDGEHVRLWDTQTGSQILKLETLYSHINAVSYSPNGRLLATGGYNSDGPWLCLWNVETGRQTVTFKGHRDEIRSLCWRPDGKQLASGSGSRPANVIVGSLPKRKDKEDFSVRLWDTNTGRQNLLLEGHGSPVRALCYRSDGRQIATGSDDGAIRLWDVTTGHLVLLLDGYNSTHVTAVYALIYRPDKQQLVSAGYDKILRIWDIHTGKCLYTYTLSTFKKNTQGLAWHNTSHGFLLATADDRVCHWRLDETTTAPRLILCWFKPKQVIKRHPPFTSRIINGFHGLDISNASGILNTTIKFLKENGAIGEPAPFETKANLSEIKSADSKESPPIQTNTLTQLLTQQTHPLIFHTAATSTTTSADSINSAQSASLEQS